MVGDRFRFCISADEGVVSVERKRAEAAIERLAALPSLGPASARMLVEAGIGDEWVLRSLGAAGCYRALRFRFGARATVNFIYALECAIRGMDWRLLEPERKDALRAGARRVNNELAAAGVRDGRP